MKRIKITQVKSGIDRNETAKRTLIALGIKKLNGSVEVDATPQILGMVRRVEHLIRVEDITGDQVVANEIIADEKEQVAALPA